MKRLMNINISESNVLDIRNRKPRLVLKEMPIVNGQRRITNNLTDYFPGAQGDGLFVVWKQNVNTPALVEEAMKGFADIVGAEIIMLEEAPVVRSDTQHKMKYFFDAWLEDVLQYNITGVHLNFKPENSIDIEFMARWLNLKFNSFRGPVIMQIDIEPRGGNSSYGWTALTLARSILSSCTVCLGWTINVKERLEKRIGYNEDDADEMISFVNKFKLVQPVLITLQATLMRFGVRTLLPLLDELPNVSYFIVMSEEFPMKQPDYLFARMYFPLNRAFYGIETSHLETLFGVEVIVANKG